MQLVERIFHSDFFLASDFEEEHEKIHVAIKIDCSLQLRCSFPASQSSKLSHAVYDFRKEFLLDTYLPGQDSHKMHIYHFVLKKFSQDHSACKSNNYIILVKHMILRKSQDSQDSQFD